MYGLTNEELVFVYLSLKTVEERYKSVLGTRKVNQQVFGLGNAIVGVHLPQEVLDDLIQSDHYQMLCGVVNKLTPIYELIADVEPEMTERIKKIFE